MQALEVSIPNSMPKQCIRKNISLSLLNVFSQVSHCPSSWIVVFLSLSIEFLLMQVKIWKTKNNPDFSKLKRKRRFTSWFSLALKMFLLFLDSTFILPNFKESQTPGLYRNHWCSTAETYLLHICRDSIFITTYSKHL